MVFAVLGTSNKKTSIYCPPLLSKTSPPAASTIMVIGRDSIHHCLELHWSHTQAQSSSGALPFVFSLLLSFPAPIAALINLLVLSSALLPNVFEKGKSITKKAQGARTSLRAFVPEFVPHCSCASSQTHNDGKYSTPFVYLLLTA